MIKDRRGGRDFDVHRPIEAITGFQRLAEGSVLYRTGGTSVLVTASVEEAVPRFLEGSGRGWITAEYQMHPRANRRRRDGRDGRSKPLSGRTREIERLIGRCLRAAVNMENLGERSLHIDCDVLEADGGTRTASISAGFVAMALALQKLYTNGRLRKPPLQDEVAAMSVGIVQGQLALDLCYEEDSNAQMDLNVCATGRGQLIEVQGTAEGRAVARDTFDEMVDLALLGVDSVIESQRKLLAQAGVSLQSLMA